MDKPTASDAPRFALADHAVVTLQGRDAAAYAQAQFMSDVATLADGHWQWSGWLTPKGRTIALFALLRHAADTVWLLLPDADAEAFAAQLRRFVFRSKVSVAVREDLRVHGAFASPLRASGARLGTPEEGEVELDLGADGGARRLLICAREAPASSADRARWRAFDLAHGWPRLAPAAAEQWTPQQLSLERLRAYSVKKGCYPGQEIVARTHFLGQAKRGLVRLRGDGLHDGDEVLVDAQSLGRIVSTADGEALAVLPLQRPAAPLLVAGRACAELPLLDGLAR